MNGKHKGGAYERWVCKQLSLWVSGGAATDVFWRSAMSGGRATVGRQRGASIRQNGDVCAVSPEGHAVCDRFYIECKHYRDLDLTGFFMKNTGKLYKFWLTAKKEARHYQKVPLMICRQNMLPDFVVTTQTLPESIGRLVQLNEPLGTSTVNVVGLKQFLALTPTFFSEGEAK